MLSQLEEAEDKRIEQQNEQAKMQQETVQAQMEAQKELAQIQHQQELEKINLEYQYKLQIEQMKMQHAFNIHATDTNNNNIEDAVEIEKMEIAANSAEKLQQDKLVADKEMLQIELQAKKDIEKIKIINKPKSIIKK
jgi:phenylpropionate dioxygenase-like ring-hydroxylating dioxygenase large terminal subunit